jgi:nitrogen fixation protein NifT
MPNVMIRQSKEGQLSFYIPKKDLEEFVVSIEHNTATAWGGQVELADGSKYYIEPMNEPPKLPMTIRVKRL